MSGGSYDYIEWKVRACADEMQRRHATEPHVVALARHLDDLAELLHRVEWADSGDTAWDDALDDDIRRFVGIGAVLDASMRMAREAHAALTDALDRATARDAGARIGTADAAGSADA